MSLIVCRLILTLIANYGKPVLILILIWRVQRMISLLRLITNKWRNDWINILGKA